MNLLTIVPAIPLGILSAYGASVSYGAVTRLRAYEEKSEKAAEWSDTAAQRLYKTRTTQTGGAISVRPCPIPISSPADPRLQIGLSLLTTFSLFIYPALSPVILAVVNATVLSLSREHMQNFWNSRNQTQIPFVEKFNLAIKGSEELITIQQLLALGWAMAGGVWWWVGV
jgi:hypothetical protein